MSDKHAEGYYSEKRAMAYVTTLFSSEYVLDNDGPGDGGIDLLVDLAGKDQGKMRRPFAIQVKGFHELPSNKELGKRISKQYPEKLLKRFEMPFLICVVQFIDLKGVCCWLLEPRIEEGRAALMIPIDYDWQPLDEKKANGVVKEVDAFYKTVFDLTPKKTSK